MGSARVNDVIIYDEDTTPIMVIEVYRTPMQQVRVIAVRSR